MVPLTAPEEGSMLNQDGAPDAREYVGATSAPLDVALAS